MLTGVLIVHIAAGSIALASGYPALFARKGGLLHKRAGIVFVCAMVVMGTAATIVAMERGKPTTALGALLVAYLVITALITVRPSDAASPELNRGLMIVGLTVGAAYVFMGGRILTGSKAIVEGVPRIQIGIAALANGLVGLLGFVGDIKVMKWGPLRGTPRLTRHLWRMCYALFTASGSFFLGQAQVIPKPLRIFPLLAFLAFLPLLAMVFWMVRARLRRRKPFVTLPLSATAQSISLGPSLLHRGQDFVSGERSRAGSAGSGRE